MNETIIRAIVQNYAKMSNEDLTAELVKQMAKQKDRDGGEKMLKTIESITPLLNAEQRVRMEGILKTVREQGIL